MRTVVHEMRNHLAVVVANVEAFVDGVLAPTPMRLEAILQSLSELDALIGRLPQHESQTVDVVFERIDLCALIGNELLALEAAAAERHIRLETTRCAIAGPSCIRFEADPLRVAQVIKNVVLNAVRYSPPGGVVRVDCRHDGDRMLLTVADEGPGVLASEKERIFESGYRGSAGNTIGGSGIGLALSKRLMEMHGGEVCVRDGPGGGATFAITLPGRLAGDAHEPPLPVVLDSSQIQG